MVGDTSHLSPKEFGVYMRLLIFAWRTPNCCLPYEPERLARMVGAPTRDWMKMEGVIMPFWTVDHTPSGPMMRQKKQTIIREKLRIQSTAQKGRAIAREDAKSLKKINSVSTQKAPNEYRSITQTTPSKTITIKKEYKKDAEENQLERWEALAERINAGRFVATMEVTNVVRDGLLHHRLVAKETLRKRGLL